MRQLAHRISGLWIPIACLVVAFAVLPFGLIWAAPGVDGEAFVSWAAVESRLAGTLGGKLEFFLMEGLGGRPPAERFVITIDHGYTAGVNPQVDPAKAEAGAPQDRALEPGRTLWLQGTLMDPDTYYGEQYLFFGYPQLYVSQVKSGFLWPSQLERLKSLYFSPVATPAAVYLLGAFPFMEEYSAGAWALIIARFLLVCLAVAAAVLYRRKKGRWLPGLVWVLGLYVLGAVGLAVPDL